MFFSLQYPDYIKAYMLMDGISPVDKSLRGPLGHELVRGGQVLIDSGVIVFAFHPWMDGNTFVFVEDLNGLFGVDQLYFLSNILIWNAVIVLIFSQTGMAVHDHLYDSLFFDLKAFLRQKS